MILLLRKLEIGPRIFKIREEPIDLSTLAITDELSLSVEGRSL